MSTTLQYYNNSIIIIQQKNKILSRSFNQFSLRLFSVLSRGQNISDWPGCSYPTGSFVERFQPKACYNAIWGEMHMSV